MAIHYIYSGAAGLNDGTSWTDAWTSITSAITASMSDGDTVYVAQDHSETGLASYTFPDINNSIWVSVDRSDDTYLQLPRQHGMEGYMVLGGGRHAGVCSRLIPHGWLHNRAAKC
jgi:hypothetical protein